jgi:hypothetical protein
MGDWLRLTSKDGGSILVNMDRMMHIEDLADGGSEISPDLKDDGACLHVAETVDDIMFALGGMDCPESLGENEEGLEDES